MSSASSVVTYTSVYTDSELRRVFWGADEELSDRGSPRVIVYGYDGVPILLVAPPSPDYIPGPEEPQTPPAPQDEDEHEPMFIQPHDPNFYVAESNLEEDPKEYEDDETEDGPVDYPMDRGDDGDDDNGDSSGDDADYEDEDEEDKKNEGERRERLARCPAPATLPSPPLPPPLHIPSPVDRRDDILENEMPPCKRLCLSTLGSKYEVKENNVPAYTERFQELTLICTKFVADETEKIDKYVSGLPNKIYENVMDSKPKTLDETIELANVLMDQKLCTYAERGEEAVQWNFPKCTKSHIYHNGPCTQKYHKCNKVWHFARDCKSSRNANVANAQRNNGSNPKGNGCFECGAARHFKRDCLKLKNKDGEKVNAPRWVYAIGNAKKRRNASRDLDSNVVTGTLFLNIRYASILFDTGTDRSFITTAFSSLIDIVPTPLGNSYDVELADGKIVRVRTIMRDCTLNFLGHPFNIDLIPVELGCQIFLAQISAKKEEDMSEGKQFEDVLVVWDYPEVFPKDLRGLPPARPVEFQIDLIPRAAPIA
nr:hypothetical protein [Tanacetum cinerariifolium]